MAKNRCSNSDAIRFIEYRDAFETNNKTMFGQWHHTTEYNEGEHSNVYAVYSYGYHFPMYVYDEQAGVWIGNKDKYSRTTSCHQTKARPRNVEHWFDTSTMLTVVGRGLAGAIAKRME